MEKKFNEEGTEVKEETTPLDETEQKGAEETQEFEETQEVVEENKEESSETQDDNEPIFFVDAYGKSKYVFGEEEYEKAKAEKNDILKKRRNRKIRTLVITVGILGLVGTIGAMAYFHNNAAKEAMSVETVEETTTEEDLNVPVGSSVGGDTDGKSVEEILGDKAVVSAPTMSETEASLESSTEAQESETEASTESLTESTQATAESSKVEVAESKAATETQAPQTQAPAPVETSPVESVPVETSPQNMDKDEFDAIKEVEQSEIESMMNNEELMDYIKDNAKKLYGN